MYRTYTHDQTNRRRGAAAVFVAVLLPLLLAFAALTVDLGAIYATRADLQDAADAAALSAASAYAIDAMTEVRKRTLDGTRFAEVERTAHARAGNIGTLNPSVGKDVTLFDTADVLLGYLEFDSPTAALRPEVQIANYNAVQVTAQRTGQSPTGVLDLFFAPIFGIETANVTATATAVFIPGLRQFDLWPFTIDENVYELAVINGEDDYAYDENSGDVAMGADGIPEILLFPSDAAPGNFGLLQIGPGSGDVDDLAVQIENGIADADFEHSISDVFPNFVEDGGDPVIYEVTGSTGLKAALKAALDPRIGDTVGVFLHDGFVEGGGTNAVYRLTQLRYVRLVSVDLEGTEKGLLVQPIDPDPGKLPGRLFLAR